MPSPIRFSKRLLLFLCLLFAASSAVASAQVLTTLVDFDQTDGGNTAGQTLAQGRDGNLRGTTTFGGANSDGTAFAMTPEGALKYVSFDPSQVNVATGLVQGLDNNFYGTTTSGGTNRLGDVYR